MKKNYFLLTAAFTFCFLFFQTFVIAQRDVYLVIGQSNAAGRGDIEAEDMVTLTGVDLYNGTSWENAVNTNDIHPTTGEVLGGLNRYSTIYNENQPQGLNFSYTFGRTLNEVTGNQIGLVVNTRGGTKIQEWEKGAPENYYGEAISQINAALALGGSTLKGILWHQGEANRNLGSYLTRLTNLIDDLRTDLGISNLPVIVGQISMQRTDNGTFNTNIKKISNPSDAAYIAFTDYASSDGLQTIDRTHFNSNGQRVLGYRYAAKVLKMIYGYTYVENEIIYIDEDAYTRGGTNSMTPQEPLEDNLIRVKYTSSNENNIRRGLLKFDISALTGTIDRFIIDASLMMNADVDSGPIDVSFYDISSSWSESTVTYDNAPAFTTELTSSTTTFNTDSGDADGDGNSDELIHGGADLTEFIKDEYDSETSTISIGLKSEADGSPQFKFTSKENIPNLALRPYLLVSYIDNSSTLSNENFEEDVTQVIKISFTNPVENEMLIKSSLNINEVSLYNMIGQEIISKKANNTSVALNVSHLLSGTYVLVIKNENRITSKLVVKK
ncbi:sialate O-acetylesterase [Xanthomarina sp. GH4-25]|uniref:sialate O-acetylesterase n=1 Tax=Xanthomarina sp. GH4-25 TaxID=3349335 RepID=UPI0038781F96